MHAPSHTPAHAHNTHSPSHYLIIRSDSERVFLFGVGISVPKAPAHTPACNYTRTTHIHAYLIIRSDSEGVLVFGVGIELH